jgi:DNA mismatch repair ATPase MutS
MQVDKITLQDIGLFDSDGVKGLMSHLNFCRSNGGTTQLEQYLSNPLNNIHAIEERQHLLSIYGNQISFLSNMKITNGTTLVMTKFFETSFKAIPAQISLLGAYWYQWSQKSDYSLIKYSVEHLVLFYQTLMDWAVVFEQEVGNKPLEKLVADVKKYTNHPSLAVVQQRAKINNPQTILQLGYFFLNQYKQNTLRLLSLYYEIDAHYSMATVIPTYQFTFPTWIDSTLPYFEITDATHPLVNNPVGNDLTLTKDSNLLFLTGANMAGKSTFIKTVGIVLYLAHVGMGVPAKKVQLSLMDGFITNLTIADNVVKGESYFFNEVQRIKNTIQKIRDGKKYLVLIDELFKGTNIQDAMKCSTKVIEGLQKLKSSLFIVSTHLYEISADLKKYNNIQFSYFETSVQNKELIFHYHLQKGISQDRIGYLILEREGVVDLLDQLAS